MVNGNHNLAAVFYILAENFDTDPFLLLLLRGKNKQEIMSALSDSSRDMDNNGINEISDKLVNLYTFWSGNEVRPVKIEMVKSNPLNRYPLPDELNDPEIMKMLFEYYNNIKKGAEKMEGRR